MTKWVYLFSEGNADMRELLGGKGANLAEMTSLGLPRQQSHAQRGLLDFSAITFTTVSFKPRFKIVSIIPGIEARAPERILGGKGANLAEMTSLGLPVPQGFTITTEACTQYYTTYSSIINAKNTQEVSYDTYYHRQPL